MNKLFLSLLTVLLLTGCQMLQTETSNYPQVTIAPEIASQIRIRHITDGRTSDDLLRVSVNAQSTSVSVKDYYFRFSWLDKDGNELKGLASHWQMIVATGDDEPLLINRRASNPKAVDYRLFISNKPGM